MSSLFAGLDGCDAEFSSDQIYRYTLTRQWSDGPCVAWIMFNPSTATAEQDDPTIRKCVGFSKRWGYGRMVILNLYAIRSTDPRAVRRMGVSAVGPLNDHWISEASKNAREVIFAWGCGQHVADEDMQARISKVSIQISLPDFPHLTPISCLGFRKDGHPRHPLMLSYETLREPFVWRKQ